MDIAAAVSDANPNIPNSAGYLMQFTNGGRYIYKKDTGTLVSILGP